MARAYFLLQAAAVAGWWIIIAIVPQARTLFVIRDAPFAVIEAFAAGDLVMIALGSALVGIGRVRSASLAWIIAGAVIYAALYTVTAAVLQIMPLWGMLLMVPAAVASVVSASLLSQHAHAEPLSTSART